MILLTEQQYAQLQQTILEMSQKLEELRIINAPVSGTLHKKNIAKRLYGILANNSTYNDKELLADELIKKHLG